MVSNDGFGKYIKKAFVQHWNLLALGVGTAAGFISGEPGVALPLVMAAEIIYLAGLSANRKFQAAVDAEAHREKTAEKSQQFRILSGKLLGELSPEDRDRFARLKTQCITLKGIADSIRGDAVQGKPPLGDMQSEGMNRLLWIYLKLLYSKAAVEKFFSTIDLSGITRDIQQAEQRLRALGEPDNDSPNDARRRASLQDQLRTGEERLANHERAKENYEFIKDELNRLSAKIASLAEMAINRQDPDFITSEVDSVSGSIEMSEKAVRELQFLTGWTSGDEVAPDLLDDDLEERSPVILISDRERS